MRGIKNIVLDKARQLRRFTYGSIAREIYSAHGRIAKLETIKRTVRRLVEEGALERCGTIPSKRGEDKVVFCYRGSER